VRRRPARLRRPAGAPRPARTLHAALTRFLRTTCTLTVVERDDPSPEPVGIRLRCEVCGEDSVIAIPAARARFGLLECPECQAGYLVLLASLGPAAQPAAAG
jgi:hypothetical protein